MTKSASTFASVATVAAMSACVGLVALTSISATANAQTVSSSTDYTGQQDTPAPGTTSKPEKKKPTLPITTGPAKAPSGASPYSPKAPKTARATPRRDEPRVAEPPAAEPKVKPKKSKKRIAKTHARRKIRTRKSRSHRKSYRRRYARRSRPRMPAPGYEGFDGPGTYCTYRREPWRKCHNNQYGEYQCRIVGWRRIESCY